MSQPEHKVIGGISLTVRPHPEWGWVLRHGPMQWHFGRKRDAVIEARNRLRIMGDVGTVTIYTPAGNTEIIARNLEVEQA